MMGPVIENAERPNTACHSTLRRGLWGLTALVSSAVIMGLEMAAARLMAPWFGASAHVWALLISLVMLALALGYFLGGRLADRSGSDRPMYGLIVGGGAYQVAALFGAAGFLEALTGLDVLSGTALAVLVLFAPPMVTLAVVSPFLTRLLSRTGSVGRASGSVYALATIGGVGGIIGVSFFLIPKLGTHASLQILAGATIGLGVVGLLHGSRSSMVGFLLLGLLPFASESAPADGIIFRGESPYNQVLVREEGGKRFLALNLPASTHSVREGDSPWTGMYYDDLAVASLLAPGSRGLVLGMGAGSSIRATHALIPDAQIDAVEIDPLVVQVADRFFDLGSDSGLHIAVADARPWLRRGVRSGEEPYDFVQIDLYHGGPFVPFYLATAEFYGEVRARMSEGGVMAMNVFDASRDGAFLQATVATLHSVFPTVLVARGEYTHLVLGILDGRSPSEILRLLSRRDRRPGSKGLASRLRPVQSAGATPVWTDDRAPVEEMTFSMLIECAETHGAACR